MKGEKEMTSDNPYAVLRQNYNQIKDKTNYTSGGGLTTAQIQMANALKNAPTTDNPSASTGSGSKKTTTTDNSAALASLYASLYGNKAAAAQAAYDASVARLDDAYGNAANAYGSIYDRGASTLANAYANSQNKINAQAKDSLRQAYVNRMMNEKNLSQQLSAMGITGGAAESSLNKILNNYGTSRADITQGWNDNLANLEDTYNSNLNNLYSAYQQNMAQLENQRASALNQLEMYLANQQSGYDESYLKLLASNPKLLNAAVTNAQNGMAAFNPNELAASNDVANVNTQQSNDMGSVASQYALYLQSLQNGANANPMIQAVQDMASQGLSAADIAKFINQNYYAGV